MILLATDLDRTLLPNGPEPDEDSSSILFNVLGKIPHRLVYVTGRSLNLVHKAQKEYKIPTPDYLIADVGTILYKKEADNLVEDTSWSNYITSKETRWNRGRVTNAVGTLPGLTLQEQDKQNQFKVSYYLSHESKKDTVLTHIATVLKDINIYANVIWSFDPLAHSVGLIDILPHTANKAAALEFLRTQERLDKDCVIYCGDSGNDIEPLTHCYRSILVKNAPQEVKETVAEQVRKIGCTEMLYIATGAGTQSGNYASGILEGLIHFDIVKFPV